MKQTKVKLLKLLNSMKGAIHYFTVLDNREFWTAFLTVANQRSSIILLSSKQSCLVQFLKVLSQLSWSISFNDLISINKKSNTIFDLTKQVVK